MKGTLLAAVLVSFAGQTPEEDFRLGVQLVSEGKLDEAERVLRSIVDEHPSFAPAIFQLGALSVKLGRPGQAADLFARVLERFPNAELEFRAGITYYLEGYDARARSHLERAAELDPSHPKTHLALGQLEARNKNFGDALAHFETACRLEPENAEAHYRRAAALAVLERLSEAIDAAAKAVSLSPRSRRAHRLLGEALLAGGRLDSAEESFDRAREHGLNDPEPFYELASAYMSESRLDDAQRVLRRGVRLAPDDDRGHLQLGWTYYLQVDDEKAAAEFETALRKRPSGKGFFYLGLAQEALGKLAEAEGSFRRAVELQPDLAPAHLALAERLIRRGLEEEGESSLRAALAIRPDSAEAHVQLGKLAVRRGDFEEALRSLETAVKLDPRASPAWYNLYLVYVRLGRSEDARQARQEYETLTAELHEQESGYRRPREGVVR